MHDQQVHFPDVGVLEAAGDASDDREALALPEGDGAGVRGHDRIELHGPEPGIAGSLLGVFAEPARDAAAPSRGRRHESAVADVRAAAAGVGLQVVAAEYFARLRARRPGLQRGIEPQRAGGVRVEIAVPGVGVAGRDGTRGQRVRLTAVAVANVLLLAILCYWNLMPWGLP